MNALLAQTAEAPASWAPVVLLIVIALGFVVGNIVLSLWLGPKRTGSVKERTYESGMTPFGDTHKRFNVRFYVVAMIFLVFDVEIVFFYPFATIFAPYAKSDGMTGGTQSGVMLASMLIFVTILLLAYLYAWGKGVFKWE